MSRLTSRNLRRAAAALLAIAALPIPGFAAAIELPRSHPSVELATQDFGAGAWGVADGGNQYLDRTSKTGVVKVTNNGPGRVAVHFIHPSGFYFVRHLQPGATLNQTLGAGWDVEVWDGGQDGLGANGTYNVP